MFFRILFCLVVAVLTACGTAKMAVKPDLEVNTVKYKLTKPTFAIFSGGKMSFGPYKASKVSQSGVFGSSGPTSVVGAIVGVGEKSKSQSISYQFKGKNNWNANCNVKQKGMNIRGVSANYYSGITCNFSPADSENTAGSGWTFYMKGGGNGPTGGNIKIQSKTVNIVPSWNIEGSPLKLGQATGYYFYLGQEIIAGVDIINSEGPIWLNKDLSAEEKDTIGMVMIALLVNQIKR